MLSFSFCRRRANPSPAQKTNKEEQTLAPPRLLSLSVEDENPNRKLRCFRREMFPLSPRYLLVILVVHVTLNLVLRYGQVRVGAFSNTLNPTRLSSPLSSYIPMADLPDTNRGMRQRYFPGHQMQRVPIDLRLPIENHTQFCMQLAKHVGVENLVKGSNLVLSPLSIHAALSMVAAGSKGKTREELCSFLRYESTEDLNTLSSQLNTLVLADGSSNGGPVLKFVNGIWVHNSLTLKPSFKEITDGSYRAEAKSVDFINKASEVSMEVNSWVDKETNGLIKELLPLGSVDKSTRLVIANALYFKGAWKDKFDGSKTKDCNFHLLDGNSIKVPFMTSREDQYVNAFNGFKVLRLPYNHGEDKRDFSMYFFLPDARDGLPNLLDKLCSEFEFLKQHIPTRKVEIGELKIPKFKISAGFEGSKTLKELGLVLPFSPTGDLSEMVEMESDRLHVSSMFHKSFVEVNEEGTEAAAATAVTINIGCARIERPIDFVADHPFLFVIREDLTGVVLFIGYVLNPNLAT